MAEDFHIKFTILGDPRPLALKRPRAAVIGKHVRVYDPAANKTAKQQIVDAAIAENGYPTEPYGGPVELHVAMYVPVPKSWSQKKKTEALAEHPTIMPTGRPDCDNVLKTIADGLSQVFIRDDAAICYATIFKRYDAQPRTLIKVKRLHW